MFLFRSIFVAAAAFATIASAIPRPNTLQFSHELSDSDVEDVIKTIEGVGSLSGVLGDSDSDGLKRSFEDASAVPAGLLTVTELDGAGPGINLKYILHGLGLPVGRVVPLVCRRSEANRRLLVTFFKTCSDGVELIVVKIGAVSQVQEVLVVSMSWWALWVYTQS